MFLAIFIANFAFVIPFFAANIIYHCFKFNSALYSFLSFYFYDFKKNVSTII